MGAKGDTEALRCLVLSDGRRGIENQALGLAEHCAEIRSLDLHPFHINPNKVVAALPPKVQLRVSKFDLPKCDIAIGCGRQAIAALMHLKRIRPNVFTVYIQDPRLDRETFDLVITPEHDPVRGANVETMIGSPNRVTQAKIAGETLRFAEGLSKLSMPRAALLIGGTSKRHKLDKSSHAQHLQAARTLIKAGSSLLISTSRRTPQFGIQGWTRFASETENVWLHDGQGPNPYFAFLGGADLILVTEDSTNMLTEACATGKPVYRLPMAGTAGKFQTLYDALEMRCGVTRFDGQQGSLDYPPLEETARAAQRLWDHYDARMATCA